MLILETGRLRLRTIERSDYPAICLFMQDIETMYAWEHAFSDNEVSDWIDENLRRYARDGYSYWAVIEKETGALIGVTGLLTEKSDDEVHVGIGYIYNKAYWHKGYACEAASACVTYAFETLQLDEVTAQIRPENIPSRKLAEKLGMTAQKQFIRTYNGKEMAHLLYRLKRK